MSSPVRLMTAIADCVYVCGHHPWRLPNRNAFLYIQLERAEVGDAVLPISLFTRRGTPSISRSVDSYTIKTGALTELRCRSKGSGPSRSWRRWY